MGSSDFNLGSSIHSSLTIPYSGNPGAAPAEPENSRSALTIHVLGLFARAGIIERAGHTLLYRLVLGFLAIIQNKNPPSPALDMDHLAAVLDLK